jgi:hypothetical protein
VVIAGGRGSYIIVTAAHVAIDLDDEARLFTAADRDGDSGVRLKDLSEDPLAPRWSFLWGTDLVSTGPRAPSREHDVAMLKLERVARQHRRLLHDHSIPLAAVVRDVKHAGLVNPVFFVGYPASSDERDASSKTTPSRDLFEADWADGDEDRSIPCPGQKDDSDVYPASFNLILGRETSPGYSGGPVFGSRGADDWICLGITAGHLETHERATAVIPAQFIHALIRREAQDLGYGLARPASCRPNP